jgi:methylated-DNA-protein-cysteine methyltransferase-like protein
MRHMDGWERVYRCVRKIPRGKVASYGLVAEACGLGRHHARQVGYALHALEDDRVPWHRVVNSKGEISHREGDHQRAKLEKEGVPFDERGRIPRRRFVAIERIRCS